MFEARVKILIAVMIFAAALIVARLVDMQVVHANVYRQQASDALIQPPHYIPAVRGRILDRFGEELAADEPCWEIRIDYGVLAMKPDYIARRVRQFSRQGRYGEGLSDAEVRERLLDEIERMWSDLVRFSGDTRDELNARGDEICSRIRVIRGLVEKNLGYETEIREERLQHPIWTGLDDQQQVAARALFKPYPWVSVQDATRRRYAASEAFGHLLGRMGPVTEKHIRNDPDAGDELARYLGNERAGARGVEQAAESLLRGRRGRYQRTIDGAELESQMPQHGADVHLSIRRDLQQRLFAMFAEHLAGMPYTPGGAVVVLHVPTREVLALVSYPGFDPNKWDELYESLRLDTRRQPLLFRAVACHYAPGSIVKPLICLAGINTGRIGLESRFDCQGALHPEHPNRFRCWAPAGTSTRMRHGPVNALEAIKLSCNIFMYNVGQLLGVDEICNYFQMVGFGKPSGTGLIEEARGINPTPDWLSRNRGTTATRGTARLFAIGQAEVSTTPLQIANLMAVYASRVYRPVTLIRETAEDVYWRLPGDDVNWWTIRRGMYGVVNDLDGTAHHTVWLGPGKDYAICGKTGSAQAYPWPVSFRVPYEDLDHVEGVAIMPAGTRQDAIDDFVRENPGYGVDIRDVTVHQRWPDGPPPTGESHSHAWFAGFLQGVDDSGQPIESETPPIAFAVLVEFGGSGGRVAGPIGKAVAELVMEMLGPDLDPDYLGSAP